MPGWIGVIVVIYRTLGDIANIGLILPAVWNIRLIALWNFLQTPDGNICIAIAGAGWLVGLVLWPSLSRKATTRARPQAVSPEEIPNHPVLPAAAPVVDESIPETANTSQPCKESWITAQGHVMELIPDQAGCTALLRSGQNIIRARFDETWSWYLSHLEDGATVSIEGKKSSEQTDRQLHLLDCVCPDGIRVRPRPTGSSVSHTANRALTHRRSTNSGYSR